MARKQSRESLDNVVTNVLELKSEYKISKTLIHNAYECVEELVNILDEDTPYLSNPTDTKRWEPLYKGHHNLIRIFGTYVQYLIHDNDPFCYDLVIVTNYNFNKFCTMGYDDFRRLSMTELLNPRPTSNKLSPEPYYTFDQLKISIKHKTDPSIFCIMTPLCHDKNKIISVTTDNKFINPAQFIITNKY